MKRRTKIIAWIAYLAFVFLSFTIFLSIYKRANSPETFETNISIRGDSKSANSDPFVASSSGYTFVAETETEHHSDSQEQILADFESTKEESLRVRNAYILSNLWKEGQLKPEIKDHLVDRYYGLVLLQIGESWPAFTVQSQQSFPFPSTWVEFTPKMYRNGQVIWQPKDSQKSQAMSVNSSVITSWSGGEFDNGDIVFYEIKIEELRDEKTVWEKVLRTNEVTVQGLKDK